MQRKISRNLIRNMTKIGSWNKYVEETFHARRVFIFGWWLLMWCHENSKSVQAKEFLEGAKVLDWLVKHADVTYTTSQ